MRANCFVFTVTLWCVIVAGIFGDTDEESAVEGESFTLRTDIKKQPQETVLWNYEDTRIAQINRDSSTSCLYDGPNGRFRDRLEVDYESGYLTITDIRFEHAGQYEGEIIRSQSSGRIQTFNNKKSKCDSTKSIPKSKSMGSSTKTVNLSVTGEVRTVSVTEGQSVTLPSGLTDIQTDDFITWMFEDTVLAEISKNQSSLAQLFYTYDGTDERFRDGLQLNHQTGSLTITQCKTSNSGLYELKINSNRHAVHLRFTVTVSGQIKTVAASGPFSGVIAGISVVVVLVLTAIVVYYRCGISTLKRGTVTPLSLMKGHDVTLTTDAELQTDDKIMWMFGDKKSPIAEIQTGGIITYDSPDVRFRDRLIVDKTTGSLTITNTRATDTGEYKLQIIRNRKIIRSRKTSFKRFSVTVFDVIKSVMEGESITLNTDAELQIDDEILWMFGDKDIVIAKIKEGTRGTTTDQGADGRFKGRLELDPQTGSLTITDTSTTHSGPYKLQIIRSGQNSFKLFKVSVSGVFAKADVCNKGDLQVHLLVPLV